MRRFHIRHVTEYNYAQSVTFGAHKLMLRPRDSHDLRLVDATLAVSPAAVLRWSYDVFGNSVAIANFLEPASQLSVVSELTVDRYANDFDQTGAVAPEAALYPFVYSPSDRIDLGGTDICQYPDPKGALSAYAQGFVTQRPMDTLELLSTINRDIHDRIGYAARYAEGTQAPLETLGFGTGTCRDLSMLMIETVRCLGFGARFVSGYLYDPALDGGEGGIIGAGDTHAWLEVYVPGAGWIEYDPTNNSIDSPDLIRVGVTRDASQAVPVGGSFTGLPSDFLGLSVSVTVHQVDPVPA